MNRKLLEFIFFVVMICIMVMSLNMAIADSSAMDINFVSLLKYTCIIVLIFAILVRFPITLIAVAAVAIGGGLYAYIKDAEIPAGMISYVTEFFGWLPQYIIGYQAFDLRFSLIFAILYIIFVTLTITLIVFNKRWYGLLIVLGVGAFTFFWFTYVSKARLYLFYYLFAALLLYSHNIYDRKKQEWIKAESKIDKNMEIKWVMNSFAIVLASILISQITTPNLDPLQWSWLSEKALQAFPFIENWRNDNFDSFGFGFGSKYGINEAGYRTARLGGPVTLSEKVMLMVETDATESIYLRGTVKDYYSGSSWGKTKKINFKYDTDEKLPLPFSASTETYRRNIKINHKNMTTSTIFAPNTLSKVQYKYETLFIDLDNEVAFPTIISKRDSYSITSEAPYVDVKQLRKIKTGEVSLKIYGQLPNNISPRVRKLAMDITSKHNNDYDKAKAIEKYLRSNYKYTLSPSEVPKDHEFVDYFLFEGKEGYCTYFATSLAVLLRSVDIPCRYVEGFLAKYEGSDVRNVPGTDAHAWVEVNFGEYGWLTFEATPAYPLVGFQSQEKVEAAPIPTAEPNMPAAPAAPVEPNSRIRDGEPEDEEISNTKVNKPKKISLWNRIFLVIIAIIIIRVLYILLQNAYIEYKLKKATGKAYSSIYFSNILGYMKKLNVVMLQEETMREYWYKVKYVLAEEYQQGDCVISLLERLRYSQEPIEEADLKLLEEYRKMLKRFVTARLGTIKAVIGLYIIGL